MSYFDLSTDGKIPRDGLRKHVQTQIPTEGGALSGLIRFRWTSSQDSWFVPSLSYVMYEFEVQKTGGNVVAADEFVTCAFAGAAASSGGPTTLQLGSTNVATITNPGVTAAFYSRAYGSKENRDTIMEPFVKGFFSDDLKTYNVAYQPPCGIFNTDVAIPSGSYVLGVNLSTTRELVSDTGVQVFLSLIIDFIKFTNCFFVIISSFLLGFSRFLRWIFRRPAARLSSRLRRRGGGLALDCNCV